MAASDVAFVGGDAADVIGELLDEVGVQVVERGSHLRRVFLVHAKDDGFGKSVGFLEKIGEMPGDGFSAFEQCDLPLKIRRAVEFVRDATAVAVNVFLAGPPAGGIPLRNDAVDAIRREETVVNALPQAVGVNGIAEVKVGVAVVFAFRSGRHAELIGRFKVFENLAPVGFFLRAAAMALVHDDEVEEVAGKFLVEAGAVFVLGDGLIGGEIHLAAEHCVTALDLVPGVAEGGESFVLGIIHEEIAVGQIQDSRLPRRVALGVPLGRPEFPANLKGDIRLARAGGHRQQHALPALQNGLHGAVNRNALIIARFPAGGEIGRREQTVGDGVVFYLLARPQA